MEKNEEAMCKVSLCMLFFIAISFFLSLFLSLNLFRAKDIKIS